MKTWISLWALVAGILRATGFGDEIGFKADLDAAAAERRVHGVLISHRFREVRRFLF